MRIERLRRDNSLRMEERSQFDILLHIYDLEYAIGYSLDTLRSIYMQNPVSDVVIGFSLCSKPCLLAKQDVAGLARLTIPIGKCHYPRLLRC